MRDIFLIFCGFVVLQTLVLNFIKKDRIDQIGAFFQKVMPTIPFTHILRFFKGKPPKDEGDV